MSSQLNVALINYGMGNLRSVSKAIENNGDKIFWVQSARGLKNKDILVLPGVGAFGQAVLNLKKLNLLEPIVEWIKEKKPFLGICLGYQLLFEASEENKGNARGLGIFKGTVKGFPKIKNLRIPHMGWNQLNLNKRAALYTALPKNPYFYFVHSYFPVPEDKTIISAECNYGINFAASIQKENLFACQFHPEKSSCNGLTLIKNIFNIYRKSK